MSAAAAMRLVRRLRRQGWLAFAGVVRPPPGACACISYLLIDWSRTSGEVLEDRFRSDPRHP